MSPRPLLGAAFTQFYAGELSSPNAQIDGYFGWSVAVSGTTVVVGAPFETASSDSDAGHAYILNAKTGALIATLTSPNAQLDGYFGYSVAVSGTTVVVGAYTETAAGDRDAGHAYILNAKTGALIATLTSPNAQTSGDFGYSVAVSGTTLVVGASDHAYIFNAKTGALIATLTSPNAQAGGDFGASVAVSGTMVVIGAPGETVFGDSYAGRAYTFNAKTGALIVTLTSPIAQADGEFGYSVAVSGTTVVIGAPYETASGDSGAGHAYTFNAKTGALIAMLTSPNVQADGWFGWSVVAVSGTTVVVGAPFENVSGDSDAGHTYTFNAKTGGLIATLTSPNAQTDGYFGLSVAVSGTTVVVGAPYESAFGLSAEGHVYLLSTLSPRPMLGAAFTPVYAGELTSPNMQTYGSFGWSVVAVNGTRVVVGAWGYAYIFNAKTGAPTLTLTGSGYFGASVAVSGTTVVVGAYGETAAGYSYAGHAYTFNAKTGALTSTLTSPNAQAYGYFGTSVAVSGTTVVVGAPYETASGDLAAGHAYIFNAKTGGLIATLTSPNAQAGGDFGWSVAVSGTTVIVGAHYENASGDSGAGHAYIFNAKTGALVATLTSPNAQAGGDFGASVAVSGTTVVVGAPWETVSGDLFAGHAYIFNAKTGALIATLTSPNAQAYGEFGVSVAVSGTTVVVGAPGETVSGDLGAGHAYTFNAKTGAPIATVASPNAQTGGGFGVAVAGSGATVVVGAPGELAFGLSLGGHVYLL